MAHKKGQGSSRNGRDSNSQRLGVKRFGGQQVTAGTILVRQPDPEGLVVFRDTANERINVLFRRKDGNLGIIEPES